jgi:hypothetical protein
MQAAVLQAPAAQVGAQLTRDEGRQIATIFSSRPREERVYSPGHTDNRGRRDQDLAARRHARILVTARSNSTTAEYADVYGGHSLAGVWLL